MPSLVGFPAEKLTVMIGGTRTKLFPRRPASPLSPTSKGHKAHHINVFLSQPLSF